MRMNESSTAYHHRHHQAEFPTSSDTPVGTGAVNLEHSCLIKTGGTTTFTNNTSENSGGAIRAFNGSEVVITGNTTFLNNSAQNDGGKLRVDGQGCRRYRRYRRYPRRRFDVSGRSIVNSKSVVSIGCMKHLLFT